MNVSSSVRNTAGPLFIFLLSYQNVLLLSLCASLAKTAEGLCTLLSPSLVQWDAMTVFLECVVPQIFRNVAEEVTRTIFCVRTKPRVEEGEGGGGGVMLIVMM